ncbi:unnamed protein product [Rhizoctonia solani]|uniref:Uncharacterized protein n=1 Tax=Rhizoctonia solani TaxID=456999 RepID=A0A8H3D5R3_9AGAM|nr:unnamed protein product [Rhizoctonia solani]CAE6515890.1 unnamed protein product [Rhizoctonia solani]
MSGACTTTSPWLRHTPNGLRASKASRSVLHGGLSTIDERNIGPSRCGFDKSRSPTTPELSPLADMRPLTPSTPPPIHPFANVQSSSSDDESSEDDLEFRAVNDSRPISPLSSRSRATANTSATDESTVQIVRARTQRINTARAHSHSIEEIRQLLSPPPESTSRLLLSWSPRHLQDKELLRNESGPSPASTPQSTPRSPGPGPPKPPPRSSARRRPRAITKDAESFLEHIHQDEPGLNSAVRTTRSVSLPFITRQSSDSAWNPVPLPPPPRPRNRALVRTVSAAVQSRLPTHLHSTPIQSSAPLGSSSAWSPKDRRPVPTLVIPASPRRDSLDHRSLYSLPLSPAGISPPPSTATPNFPQSPHSTIFHTAESTPITPLHASFLPSCKTTSVRSSAIREDWSSPRPSKDHLPNRSSNRLSTLSNPFGDFSFLRPLVNNRASGISFTSNVSGSSARSPTEAECIPIGLHRATSQDTERDEFLLPVTPRSSWLRSGFEIDVHLPQGDEDEDECESSRKSTETSSLLSCRERAKSLTLPHIPVASLNKVDRVLGKGASRALISGVHDHVPHHFSPSSMSSSPENVSPTTTVVPTDPTQQSFLPSTAPPSAFSMGGIGRRLSKRSSPSSERRRSEEVPRPSSQASVGLMARMDRFIGRTPSPAGRTRELDSEDEAPCPPPILTFPKPIHGRKHSSSDPSVGLASTILTGRPSTSNMRTAAERAELVKKTRKIQQMLGDVPPVSGATGSTFYRVSRAARSEDSLVSPTSAVLVIGGSTEHRGHRSTASLSSRPLLALSPGLQTDGLLNIRTSGSGDDFGLGLNDAGLSPITSAQPEDIDGDGHENDQDEDETALARRAKRAKVAKLHRYLGSRVPAHLVLGLDESWDPEQDLPDVRSEDGAETGSMFSAKKKRRASDGDYTLHEEEINDLSVMSSEEKARAVRRKAKMEKMFGERPPQKLYQLYQAGTDTPSKSDADHDSAEEDDGSEPLDGSEGGEHYQSYRASFNSLAYFVSNADRDSLEGLYDIVSSPSDDPEAQRNQFTARRKRAAKLSNFFGVTYRDLFGAVLDILESDVKEDKEEGSLTPAETQDLLRKLRSLKDIGEKISS